MLRNAWKRILNRQEFLRPGLIGSRPNGIGKAVICMESKSRHRESPFFI